MTPPSLPWIVNDNILYKDAFLAVGVKGFFWGLPFWQVLIRQSVEGSLFGRRQESFPDDPNWLGVRQEGIPAGALENPRWLAVMPDCDLPVVCFPIRTRQVTPPTLKPPR